VDTSVGQDVLFPPYDGDLGRLCALIGVDTSSTRELLLELTMRDVARVGPASFNTRTVCAELGVTHPLVQYHFGSRDGLIAEAGHRVFLRFIDRQLAAVDAAPRTPIDRLLAHLTAGLRLTVEMRGWGAVLNYFPFYSTELTDIVVERFEEAHTAAYERSIAVLAQLVIDVWDDRVGDVPLGDMSAQPAAERAGRLADPAILEAMSTLSFTMHGLGVWRAGHVRPSAVTSSPDAAEEALADRLAEGTITGAVARLVASRDPLQVM
jgi:AcrR family transcriptional regulator